MDSPGRRHIMTGARRPSREGARGPRTFDVPQGRCREASGNGARRALHMLLQYRRRLVPPPPANRAPRPDLLELAQEHEEELVWLAVLSHSQEICKVDVAAQRLAAGHYGVCADCQAPIPFARLRALPFALRCLPCQQHFEHRDRPIMAR